MVGGAPSKLEVGLGQDPTPEQAGVALPREDPLGDPTSESLRRQPSVRAGLGVHVPVFGLWARFTGERHGRSRGLLGYKFPNAFGPKTQVLGPEIPTRDVQTPVEKLARYSSVTRPYRTRRAAVTRRRACDRGYRLVDVSG
jgi:hypothetical protein